MIFPNGSISTTTSITGNSSKEILATTSPTRILAVRMQQSGTASETVAECQILGGTSYEPFAYNFAKDYPQDLMNYVCTGNIRVKKTGNDTSFFSITYIPEYAYTATIQQDVNMQYTGFNSQEGSFVAGVIIFLLALFTLLNVYRYQSQK